MKSEEMVDKRTPSEAATWAKEQYKLCKSRDEIASVFHSLRKQWKHFSKDQIVLLECTRVQEERRLAKKENEAKVSRKAR